MAELITITIDDQEVEVPEGELIVEAVKRIRKEIPIFCYHPLLKPVGMCRMCLVEIGMKKDDGTIQKMPKPQAACTLPASKGMVVYTDTESVHNDRKGVLEFLLINHPLDCPICDKGGECPLQNNTLFYGSGASRYTEIKRHLPKAFPLSKYVCLDLERCIQCGRCTRFTEEISGDGQLSMLFRGAQMQPNTFQMSDFTSKFSGNTIEICPVGALTSQEYRFRARPWDLLATKTICTGCSNGCCIWLDHRRNTMVRISGRGNPAVNEDWTCDKGKFGHHNLRTDQRPGTPLHRRGDHFVPAQWHDIYAELIAVFRKAGPARVAGLGGGKSANEDNYLFQKLFRQGFGSNNIDHRMIPATGATGEYRMMPTPIADLEKARGILVFAMELSDEQPIVYLRVRKASFRHGAKIVVATTERTDMDMFADVILRYKPGTEAALLKGLLKQSSPEECEKQTGVSAEALRRAIEIVGGDCVTLYGSAVKRHPDCAALEQKLGELPGVVNYLVPEAGSRGATEMGVLPDRLPGLAPLSDSARFGAPAEPGMNTEQMLRAAAEGKISALFLNCVDPLSEFPDRALAEKALENVEFLAVMHYLETECKEFASVFLPAQSWAEREGTYTNVEGRVQRIHQALQPVGSAKAPWEVFADILFRLTAASPPFGPSDVMDEIASLVPEYAGARYGEPARQGERMVAAP